MFPKRNVYWSKVRQPGQPFTEIDPVYGKVYHTGDAADVQQMMDAEGAYWYHAHPRTKGTTGYPDLIFDKPYVKNDRYLGVAFKPSMGMDLSEAEMPDVHPRALKGAMVSLSVMWRLPVKAKRLASRKLYMLQGLPGVGPALANRLLLKFGSVGTSSRPTRAC